MSQTNSNNAVRYRNLHITGQGFVNRIRTVFPEHGDPYLACSISLEEGKITDGDYSKLNTTYVDCRIAGEAVKRLFTDTFADDTGKLQQPGKTPVRAYVRLAGLTVKPFIYQSGEKQGQPGASVYGRLMKVDGLFVGGDAIDLGDYYETTADPVSDHHQESET